MRSQVLAMCAGCLGAMASVTGKLGMSGVHVNMICQAITHYFYAFINNEELLDAEEIYVTEVAAAIIRGLLLLLTFALNALMWTLFMESMQTLNSGEAVVLNTGTNILISAIFGTLIFGETLSGIWWCGATVIIIGMAVLQTSSSMQEKSDKRPNKVKMKMEGIKQKIS